MEPSKGLPGSMRGGARTKSVGTKLTEAEFARIDALAAGSGQTLSEWVRETLLGAAPGQASGLAPSLAPVPAAGDGRRVADEILLSEVLALRAILLNLLYDMVTGEALDEERMKALILRGDADKREKAKVRLHGGEESRRSGTERDER